MARTESSAITDLNGLRRVLSLVRCIALHMAADGRDSAEAAWHLTGRIGAIGRAALASARCGVDLESLVRDELRDCAAGREREDVEGPNIRLNARSAQLVSLAVHELATNAIKFGALCQAQARLQVRWRQDERTLHFEWRELGIQLPAQAPRAGFGSLLVKRLIAAELRGRGEMVFSDQGLHCYIDVPLSEALYTDD
jgi:two-component system CheB/CheR fusion protein